MGGLKYAEEGSTQGRYGKKNSITDIHEYGWFQILALLQE